MPKNQDLVKRRNDYLGIAQPSLRDSVIAKMLDLAAQITRQEIQAGEARFWRESFKNERPEMIEAGFRLYLEHAKFLPKPGDIRDAIEQIRGRVPETDPKVDREALAAHQATQEWEEESRKARMALAKIAGPEFERKLDALLKGMTMPGGKK